MARTPLIALCVFVIGVVSGVAMNFNVIVPTLARSVLQVGAPGLGILMAAIGFGSLSGALAVAMLRQPRTVVITAGAALLGGVDGENLIHMQAAPGVGDLVALPAEGGAAHTLTPEASSRHW